MTKNSYSIKNTLLVFLIFTLCSIYACKKDKCQNPYAIVRTHELNPTHFPHIMVYKDFDTIRLLKNKTDTLLYIGDKIQQMNKIVPAEKGCGTELFEAVKHPFANSNGDSLIIYYDRGFYYNDDLQFLSVGFNDTSFSQYSKSIVECDSSTSTIEVLGKTYCAKKLGFDSPGQPYVYFGRDFGILKIFSKNDTYERIP